MGWVAMRGTWRCNNSRAMVATLLLLLLLLAVRVESTRVQREFASGEVNGAAVTTTTTMRDGVVEDDPVWDVETESPPAQRQRDRSLWGMSKRLVPTGPNPLHN